MAVNKHKALIWLSSFLWFINKNKKKTKEEELPSTRTCKQIWALQIVQFGETFINRPK